MSVINIDMPIVKKCYVQDCGYNSSSSCHAKAITIGDFTNPGCDTYLSVDEHSKETRRIAGVGACKVSSCKHNRDYECGAIEISVGYAAEKINCLTFDSK